MAWNYALCWIVVFPFELLCGAYVMAFWVPPETVPYVVWIILFFFLIFAINLFGVLGYGEGEYIFSFIKVAFVCIFIVMGIVIDAGGGPTHKVYGTTYWKDPGTSLEDSSDFRGI